MSPSSSRPNPGETDKDRDQRKAAAKKDEDKHESYQERRDARRKEPDQSIPPTHEVDTDFGGPESGVETAEGEPVPVSEETEQPLSETDPEAQKAKEAAQKDNERVEKRAQELEKPRQEENVAQSDHDYERAQRDRQELRVRHGLEEVEIGKDFFADAAALNKRLFEDYNEKTDYWWVRTMLETAQNRLGQDWTRMRDTKAESSKDRSKVLTDRRYNDDSKEFDPGFANSATNEPGRSEQELYKPIPNDRSPAGTGPSAEDTGGATEVESLGPAEMRAHNPEMDKPGEGRSEALSVGKSDQTPKEHSDAPPP
jgi:hypothetical protein